MTMNPYAVTAQEAPEPGVYGNAKRLRGGFLYRLIDIGSPVPFRFAYSGWWFIQRIKINRKRVWWKVSWLRIERKVVFELPESVDSESRMGEVIISFGPTLFIERFQVWIAGEMVYDEMA